MNAVAATASAAVPRAVASTRVVDGLMLAMFFVMTFEKVHWRVAGAVGIVDILAILFLIAFGLTHHGPVPRTAVAVLGFFAAFLLVYLFGFFNLATHEAMIQFVKGMVKFVLHFLLVAAALTRFKRGGERLFWLALTWFTAGLAVNSVYGILQLIAARAGVNLDSLFISPLTGGASAINTYGAVDHQSVYRPNALTGDPNHLGVMLIVPLLVLTPVYLRLERDHPVKRRLAVVLAFMLIVLFATLSRSGGLGLLAGAIVLALPYRRFRRRKALVKPLAAVAFVLAVVILTRLHYFWVVIKSRVQTGGGSTRVHFAIYDFVPKVMHMHPLLGLGLNNFSVYYQQVTGKTNWGPHSFYVALIVETGAIGSLVFLAFLVWVFRRLRAARALGRRLTELGDPAASRVRPLAWGCTAALVGTIVSNGFYLTMQFYYFYAFLALALAVPIVFAHRARTGTATSPTRA